MSALPSVRIVWNNCTVGEWNALVAAVPRSTLTQTFAYAEAMLLTDRWQPRLGLVEWDDQPAGLVLALEKNLIRLVRIAKIHRGPLWLPEADSPALREATLGALRRALPPGITRWTTLVPELPESDETAALLARCGFRRAAGAGYRTIWLDLRPDLETLRAALRGNWRNHLRQAEASPLVVEEDGEHRNLPWLVENYLEDKAERGYRGPSGPLTVRLRNALHKGGGPQSGVLLLCARDSTGATADGPETRVAGALFLRHGKTATYQIGLNQPEGRRHHAHQLLLWQGICRLKAAGVWWLDLGGINPEHAPGVTAFKRGLGGDEVTLAGTYA